jgi:uncharacterized protein YjeT (DUF2065 family)
MQLSGWELLGLILAGVLMVEALMPLLMTRQWRQTLAEVLQLSDGQVRFFALIAMAAGVLLAFWSLA